MNSPFFVSVKTGENVTDRKFIVQLMKLISFRSSQKLVVENASAKILVEE